MFIRHFSEKFISTKVVVKTSPKPKRQLKRKISKAVRKVVKINLLNILNNTITRPIVNKLKHKEIIEIRKKKIKEEFHGGSLNKNPSSDKENMSPTATNVRFIEFSSPSNESSPNSKPSLRQQLISFAQKHNPKPEMFEDLLNIMTTNGLKIPRSPGSFFDDKFEVIKMTFGSYLNIGVERGIKNYYRPSFIRKPMALVTSSSDDLLESSQPPEILLLDVAVYIVKSNQCNGLTVPQCMIIFGRINCEVFSDPFVIGIYYGSFASPMIGNEILKLFVSEMKTLSKQELVIGGNQAFQVKLNAFVCDPISNSLITCTSLPSSLYGCSKCNQTRALNEDGFVSFPTTSKLATLRSDDDFKYLLDNDHHLSQPLLAQLDLGLISQFTIDYKIIVCNGVMKHMMNLWVCDRLEYRINKDTQLKISRDLILMSGSCPRELVKRPRPLEEISSWDSFDWNEFLLYYSPVALQGRLQQKYYCNFLYLHLAMRILMSSDSTNTETHSFLLGRFLNIFIADFTKLYGSSKIDYNIHNLLHFEQIQQKLGPLKKLNGFVYNDQINMVNTFIDASSEVNLEEIGEKIIENSSLMAENKINELININYPFVDTRGELVFKNFVISVNEPDNHIIMAGNVIVKVEAICNDIISKEILIIGRRYEKVEIMFEAPLSNQKLFLVSSLSPVYTFKTSDLLFKAVKFDHPKHGSFIQCLIT